MKALIGYKIPFSGLKNGIHHFDFDIDKHFFKHFEDSIIDECQFGVHLIFDKQPSMFVLDFSFNGTLPTTCDRCANNVDLPITGNQHFIVKKRLEPGEDEDIIYIKDIETDLNVAPMIYEMLHLNIPLKRACELNEEDLPSCGFDLSKFSDEEYDDDLPEDDDNLNDIWSALKDFNK